MLPFVADPRLPSPRCAHSITSSARASNRSGTVMPRALGWWTGNSAGFSPFQDPARVEAGQTISVTEAASVAHYTARFGEVARLLEQTLEEETTTDKLLSKLAEGAVNRKAA